MPAYNTGDFVGMAIGSVLRQTCGDFELIVVDDGSTDDTAERVRRCADARVRLIQQTNRGPAAARNTAIRAACGAYVSMLDSDDLWLPSYLESMGRAFENE